MPDRIVVTLLQEWREAERNLASLPVRWRSRERTDAQRRVDSLRIAYHEAARVLEELYGRGEVLPTPAADDRPRVD